MTKIALIMMLTDPYTITIPQPCAMMNEPIAFRLVEPRPECISVENFYKNNLHL